MQAMLLQMLQQRAAGRMDDAFRHAGRAGGKQDVERMRERQPLECRPALRRTARANRVERPAPWADPAATASADRRDSRRPRALQRSAAAGTISASLSATVVRLAVVPVAVAGDEAPSARSGRTGRARPARRNRASRTTRPRRSRPPPASRRSFPACSASSPRPGRPALTPCGAQAPAAGARPARAARPSVRRRSTLSSPRKTSASPLAALAQQVLGEIQLRIGKEARAPSMSSPSTRTRSPLSPMTPQ